MRQRTENTRTLLLVSILLVGVLLGWSAVPMIAYAAFTGDCRLAYLGLACLAAAITASAFDTKVNG